MSAQIRPSRKERDVELHIDTTATDDSFKTRRGPSLVTRAIWTACTISLFLFAYATLPSKYTPTSLVDFPWPSPSPEPLPDYIKEGIEQCKVISRPLPNPKPDSKRSNDRFVSGTPDVLLRNATVWTGNDDGEEILRETDVLLSEGVVKEIGKGIKVAKNTQIIELVGSWITPGIVDMHSHMGVDAAPGLRGSDDTNSLKSPILPWLRSMDGFNTHDLAFNLSISGGITTMLVLPGSAGNIGGQAFTFKPRWTAENTPTSMQVDPPFVIKHDKWKRTRSWRHIKHACGENPARVYGNTRMDSAYDFRRAYTKGKELKQEQDRWCSDPKSQSSPFPTSLEWEVLADVIRGNVKVNIHCYETTDLNSMVRISNEFQFPIAAFHHAHETYLVPELLKSTWGPTTPGVALFATNARYKREAYRGSEFAPAILAREGIRVAMKSDHPVLDSRYLVYEAAQAHHYGLNASQALSTVTTHSAQMIGLDHRLGYVRVGYDADIVVWDSHPLNLGATPKQVYIDGIAQLVNPHVTEKPAVAQLVTPAGEWEEGAWEALATRGDPDLSPRASHPSVLFVNVEGGDVAMVNGQVVGSIQGEYETVDLKGGSITPGLITVGSGVGVLDIAQEKSTWDGIAYDPLSSASDLLDGLLNHAVDGVSFGGKDELYAYRSGVTTAVPFPISSSFILGISCAINTGAPHPLAPGAILKSSAAIHLSLLGSKQAVSTRLAVLRRILTADNNNSTESWEILREAKRGERRVVVHANKADTIASLVRLKRDVAPGLKLTILGGAESWLIADDLAREDVGVIVSPARSWPADWQSRRIMPGPPLSNMTLPAYLASRGVLVGLGIEEEWAARNTRNDAAWVYANNPEVFSKSAALDLVSGNLRTLLGLDHHDGGVNVGVGVSVGGAEAESPSPLGSAGWVAWEGDWTTFGGKVRAVGTQNGVHVF